MMADQKLHVIENTEQADPAAEAAGIPKPGAFDLDRFKSKHAATVANVETLLTALPHHKISEAKDFVRLHPDENAYWSSELCFVNVPIKGAKRDSMHLIDEALAMRYLESARILRFRLALGSKPNDVFFLCHVPTLNPDNTWNASNIDACEQAKTLWVAVTSRKEEGIESYKVTCARDPNAFAEPRWPTQSLNEIIFRTFERRCITDEGHPGLLRLIGAAQSLS
jgi:hypothetical protein